MNFAQLAPWFFVGLGLFALSRRTDEEPDDGTPVFRMFGVSWCGHCKDAKPEFVRLGTSQTVNGRKVRIQFVDAEKKEALAKQFGVDSYPQFYLTIDGRNVAYNGERKYEAFLAFLNQSVEA